MSYGIWLWKILQEWIVKKWYRQDLGIINKCESLKISGVMGFLILQHELDYEISSQGGAP